MYQGNLNQPFYTMMSGMETYFRGQLRRNNIYRTGGRNGFFIEYHNLMIKIQTRFNKDVPGNYA